MQKKGFLLLALVCGLIAAGSTYVFLSSMPNSPNIEMRPIVIAKSNISARSIIKEEQLMINEVPSQGYPVGGASSIESVVGSVALINLTAGDSIVGSMIKPPQASNPSTPSADSYSLTVPEGKRAVAVPINLVSGVGYSVQPGDYVDVLVTMDIINSTGNSQPTTSLAAQDVLVLSVGGGITTDDPDNAKSQSRSYTLALSVPQAMAVTHGSEKGSIRLLLRNPANTDVQSQTPFTPEQFLDPDYFNHIQ